ncbi:hypothetical protein NDN08_001289 [Rhodosorus marinus]|uniref:Clathrin heavy chain n=1 Tax=Rhodosorus marinus TaxID=101924 RepID=A0AAV8UQJ3_9RHOD|nr:hypothetical protein NDN08_001289 [Rhodosorus marinus]
MASVVSTSELLSLPALGVDAQFISFQNLTLESSNFLCVRETNAQGAVEIVIVDLMNPSILDRRPMSAESVLMNPESKVMALRARGQLQLFDYGTRAKLKGASMSEQIDFWKWISPSTVGIVTPSSVYHWRKDDQSEPVKVFDRHASLKAGQNPMSIITYRADLYEEWLCLVGIAPSGGSVVGQMQLYSTKKKISQAIEGQAATFATMNMSGHETTLFAFANRNAQGGKLHIIEVGQERKDDTAPKFEKKQVPVNFPADAPADFPVSMQVSSKYGILYLVTKMGYVHVFDIETATNIAVQKVSSDPVFISTPHKESGGLVGVDRQGRVLLTSINEAAVVPYVQNTLGNPELAIRIAAKNGFPGAEQFFVQKFNSLFEGGHYKEAAMIAGESPAGFLRTQETMQRFKDLPSEEGKPAALLVYFQTLLENGKLNKIESVELGELLLSYQRVELLEKWIKEDKLECSEELGDVIKSQNSQLATAVFVKAEAHMRVIQGLLEAGQTEKVPLYAERVGLNISQTELVSMATSVNPTAALQLMQDMGNMGNAPTDHKAMVEMLLNKGMVQEATTYCVNKMTDSDENGEIQTKLLESNLQSAPQVADAILTRKAWTKFDNNKVAKMAERAGLYNHALASYSDIADVKRVLQNASSMDANFVTEYFGTMNPDDAVACLQDLVRGGQRANLPLAVQIGSKYHHELGTNKILTIFASLKNQEALFMYLNGIIESSDDPDIHFKYIEVGCKLQQFQEVERITRESEHYEPERVKNFLKDMKLRDPRPLINVCDKYNYVGELIKFMVKNNQLRFVEGYVQKVNPARCPVVVGSLLDLDQDEEFIKGVVMSVKNTVNIEELVKEVEERKKLRILLPFFESRMQDGDKEPDVHTGMAKVYVDCNVNPEHFLETDELYDHLQVGAFCEKRDPHLAFMAYMKGQCDEQLLDVTTKNHLFKEQAQYLVAREDLDLWAQVLDEENEHRKLLVEQVISSALPETKEPEKVSSTVKAFIAANMPSVLMELLETLVLQTVGSVFSQNRNLQNLLLLTSIKADKSRVMDYVRRLDNFDGVDVAQIAIAEELYEEAFAIYAKIEKYDLAVDVLLDNMKDFDRGKEFAAKVDRPEVWSRLGAALVENDLIIEGVNAIMKAKDPGAYMTVISKAKDGATNEDYKVIVKYLKFARGKAREGGSAIDSEIVYGLCVNGQLSEMEEFISSSNQAELEEVGDRVFEKGLFDASKILFSSINNHARLACVLVKLGDYQAAVDASKKANKISTWKFVCFECVEAKEFRLAQTCGLQLIVEASELQEVIDYYERRGYFTQLIDLLDAGLVLERAIPNMFTNLGVLLTKYREERMMDFCKMWWQRANVPRLLRACDDAKLYAEKVYLHTVYKEYDQAAATMIEHAPSSWSPSSFIEVMTKATNVDVMVKGVRFYIEEHPQLLNDLLQLLGGKMEEVRTIAMLKTINAETFGPLGILPLCKEYLLKLQEKNTVEVNEALNNIYIREGDLDSLRRSAKTHKNFNIPALAHRLETHELLNYRRLAVELYKEAKKYERAIELAKEDSLYKDAIDCVAASKDAELTEQLAQFFLENGLRECYSAVLYTCFEFFRPDVAIEMAWSHQVMDFTMPFVIQTVKEISNRVIFLEEIVKEQKEKAEEDKKAVDDEVNDDTSVLLYGVPSNMGQTGQLMFGGSGGPAQLTLPAPPSQ